MNLILLLISLVTPVRAAPLLDRGTPAGPEILVFQDHADRNLYYFNPRTLRLARDERGVPLFRYTEYWTRGKEPQKRALIQFMIETAVDTKAVEEAKANIRRVNPAAEFSAVPFVDSKIALEKGMDVLITRGSCGHRAGVIGQLQDCTLNLTASGRRRFLPSIRKGRIMPIQMEYVIPGMIQKADGTFEAVKAPMGVAGYIMGNELVEHPELFQRL